VGLDFRLKASGTLRESSPREGQAYLEARLVRNRIALYIDQTVGPNRAVSRELFALVEKLPVERLRQSRWCRKLRAVHRG
jgi:hypothetical protein